MSEQRDKRGEAAAYAMGALSSEEQAGFETELARDRELAAELRALGATVALLREAAEPFDVPEGLADRVHAEVARTVAGGAASLNGATPLATAPVAEPEADKPQAAEPVVSASQARGVAEAEGSFRSRLAMPRVGWSWPRRIAFAGGLAVSLAAAVVIGAQLGGGSEGELEVAGDLTAPDGGATVAAVDVRELGIGREISLESDSLPILPKGEYYEVWFVAPDDSASDPNRISAGTFHPDLDGSSDVDFTAAVDPSLYPLIEITAEPGDGDPAPTDNVVARLDSAS